MSVRRSAFWTAFTASLVTLAAFSAVETFLLGDLRPDVGGFILRVAMGSILAGGSAVLVAAVVSRVLTARLRDLSEAAERLARRPSPEPLRATVGDPEVARLHRAFAAIARSLHALLERERSFARYASHELRTPVGALKVQLERVELGTASAAEVLPAVARQAARIEELIDALLALARTRAQLSRVQPLRALLAEAMDPLTEIDRPRVYIVEPVPEVRVRDAVLVGQALRNLVDNAVRHGAGPVTVRAEHAGETLTVRVRDMGAGIPVTELRRLADPAERRRPLSDGHGLGLTLVTLIARALDGHLHLHNTDVGLEASIVLKVLATDAPR